MCVYLLHKQDLETRFLAEKKYRKPLLLRNLLAGMMRSISLPASLSQMYTNHYLRVTAIIAFQGNEVKDKDICSASRHKSTEAQKRTSLGLLAHGHEQQ